MLKRFYEIQIGDQEHTIIQTKWMRLQKKKQKHKVYKWTEY